MGYESVAEVRGSPGFVVEMIRTSTAWEGAPGAGLSVAARKLVVTHSERMQGEVAALLARLRAIH